MSKLKKKKLGENKESKYFCLILINFDSLIAAALHNKVNLFFFV